VCDLKFETALYVRLDGEIRDLSEITFLRKGRSKFLLKGRFLLEDWSYSRQSAQTRAHLEIVCLLEGGPYRIRGALTRRGFLSQTRGERGGASESERRGVSQRESLSQRERRSL